MRTCPKCDRANIVTRKFCTRCGASLLVSLEEPAKEEKVPAPTIVDVKAEPEETYTSSTEPVSATTDDKSVRPSEVDRDRLRTSAPKEKSEMEKAMEAFSKADEVGIEEADSGIVEVRMLRASEVHELMGETITDPEPSSAEPAEPPKPATPPTTEAPQSPPIDAPITGTPSIAEPDPPPSPVIEPPPVIPETLVEPAREREPAAHAPKVETTPKPPVSEPTPPPTVASLEKPIPEIDALLSKIPEHLTDARIKELTESLTHLHIELKQVKSDLDSVSVHLNEEVRNYRNTAEVKRIHFESLEEQIRLAKKELSDVQKEFQNADNRRNKEFATRNKRIKEIEKRIGRYEDAILKRGRELQKQKEKLAKQADMKAMDG